MNWGTKIAIFYTLFALSMIAAVIYASMQSFHLVSPDYYAEEIAYETRIQEIQNVRDLQAPITMLNHRPGQLEITLPRGQKVKEGSIRFYRPSDARQDQIFPIDPTTDLQLISVTDLPKGNWLIQISWTDGAKNFYYERNFNVFH